VVRRTYKSKCLFTPAAPVPAIANRVPAASSSKTVALVADPRLKGKSKGGPASKCALRLFVVARKIFVKQRKITVRSVPIQRTKNNYVRASCTMRGNSGDA
jgi:hypothetical protein